MKVKILIIRLSSIGDVVLTTPVIRCVKNQVENAEIHFVTKQKFASILASNPYIAKVHVYNDSLSNLINELKAEKFNYVIDLHQNFRSNRIKRSLSCTSFSVDKLNWQKFLLIKFKINRLPNKHIVDRYLDSVAPLNVKNDGKGLDYFIPVNENFNESNLPALFKSGYIAFVIAGTYNTKKLPVEKVAEICRQISYPVILLGGRKEFDDGEKIISQSNGNVLNLAGKTSLNQSASLVKNAKLVLTNDTGLMHIAAVYQKKILSFWGNTVPAFGMTPYLPDSDSKQLEVDNLKCRPCSKLGFQHCPKKHFRCMNEINVAEAIHWIEENWER